jgi:hypothetical protein
LVGGPEPMGFPGPGPRQSVPHLEPSPPPRGVEALASGPPLPVGPRMAEHVAELAHTVENHGLLLARLLDNE